MVRFGSVGLYRVLAGVRLVVINHDLGGGYRYMFILYANMVESVAMLSYWVLLVIYREKGTASDLDVCK